MAQVIWPGSDETDRLSRGAEVALAPIAEVAIEPRPAVRLREQQAGRAGLSSYSARSWASGPSSLIVRIDRAVFWPAMIWPRTSFCSISSVFDRTWRHSRRERLFGSLARVGKQRDQHRVARPVAALLDS